MSDMKYEVISAVCETGNFTKAAEKLNYSQSAVSQAVRNFEKELGVTLFERSKKGVKPLDEAMPIIESIRKIHEEEEKMKAHAKKMSDSESGVVKIAYLGEGIESWFWELFQTFGELYPKIRCEIRKRTHPEVENELKNGLLDFAFSFATEVDGYEFFPYGEDELVIVLPKEHKLSVKDALTMQDIAKEKIVMTAEYAALEFQRADVQFYFSEESMILKYVEQGKGICILPKSFINMMKSEFEVGIRSFEKKCYQTWGMIYPKSEKLTNAAKKFLDHVVHTYKKYPVGVDSAIGDDCRI